MVFQLVYSSKAAQQFWPDDLFALVEKSRRKNAERDITGMLLFHEGNFLQLLEGPENAVRSCFNIVERDPRHATVQVFANADARPSRFSRLDDGLRTSG